MFQLKWLIIAALLSCGGVYCQSKWIHMRSLNFEAFSSAGEQDTREALRYFERVRDFFLQANQREVSKPVPVQRICNGLLLRRSGR